MNKTKIIKWLLDTGVLKFGNFTLKSGRKSNYFFNLGEVYKGKDIAILANTYYKKLFSLIGTNQNVIFGPAYKGIPLCVSVAMHSESLAYCFDRKEDKTHGDKGKLVGASLEGQDVIIIDDVITSGGSILDAAKTIKEHNGNLIGVIVFVDRMEQRHIEFFGAGDNTVSSIQAKTFLEKKLQIPILSVLNIAEIISNKHIQEIYPKECKILSKQQLLMQGINYGNNDTL